MTEIVSPYVSGRTRPTTIGAYLNRTTHQRRPAGRLLSISSEQFQVELVQRTRALCGFGKQGDARLSGDLVQLWQSGNGEHRQELRVNAWEYGVHDVCLRSISEPDLSPLLCERQRPTFTLFRQELVTAWESWAGTPEAREALDALRWCGYGRLRTVLRAEGWHWQVVSAEIERQMSDERLSITGTAELMGLTR